MVSEFDKLYFYVYLFCTVTSNHFEIVLFLLQYCDTGLKYIIRLSSEFRWYEIFHFGIFVHVSMFLYTIYTNEIKFKLNYISIYNLFCFIFMYVSLRKLDLFTYQKLKSKLGSIRKSIGI